MQRKLFILTLFFAVATAQLYAQPAKVFKVQANNLTATIQPTMWGIFFEDINMGADGGLYAELVKNRSFEFPAPLMCWRELRQGGNESSLLVNNRSITTQTANPRYVTITVASGKGAYGLSNEGFRGMGIKSGDTYHFSVLARASEGSNITMNIEVVNAKGEKIGTANIAPQGGSWKNYTTGFVATGTEPKGRLNIWFTGNGKVDIDMVSLFPEDTWKNRPGGLRADLVQLLADMKPGFIRFPGGCIVEGRELQSRYQWKKTIGPLDQREMIVNRWNTEFKHRLTTDYYQSFGLGFLEYFQLAEDIGAEPLPILNCGMACQFNSAEVVPVDEIDPFVQDALDLIEFANGSTDTKWGKLRAQLGHPAPFHLKMMGVGNEQWGPQYIDRYRIFTKAIKDKYPEIKLVNSTGTDPNGERFNYLNDTLRKMNADILDEHYYRAPDWFLQNAKRYDDYDRNGSKVFAGEYAAQSVAIASPDNKNNWRCALAEAAYMTGLERNADVVNMASYAPLFAHAEGWQWTPDLIWFDNLKAYGTPNYYVQKLYSNYKGTNVVPILLNNEKITGQDGCYATACIDKNTSELIVKIVNASANAQATSIAVDGVRTLNATGTLTVLKGEPEGENSFTSPDAIKPVDQTLKLKGKNIPVTLAPYSFNIIRVKMQ